MKRIQVVLLLFAIVPMFAITKAIADNNNQPNDEGRRLISWNNR